MKFSPSGVTLILAFTACAAANSTLFVPPSTTNLSQYKAPPVCGTGERIDTLFKDIARDFRLGLCWNGIRDSFHSLGFPAGFRKCAEYFVPCNPYDASRHPVICKGVTAFGLCESAKRYCHAIGGLFDGAC